MKPMGEIPFPIGEADTQMKTDEQDKNYCKIEGIFIKQDFDHFILEENEVDQYTSLQKFTMKQTLYLPYKYDI